ncbi:SDR family oxidoreductase [Bordetella tumbae]|uniref:SDR family NAD(P)-dependent oxidoreductase n=1 Tax=Bordetella tumbae TaxID=1649139 RepID=UPI0039F11B7A
MKLIRSALVTGAASGIGLAIATQLARAGYRVLLADRDPAVHQIAATLPYNGQPHLAVTVDLGQEDEVLSLARAAVEDFGGCDILVNNAGINIKKQGGPFPLEEVSNADWERVFRINVMAPFMLCRALLPEMRSRGWGRVINIASRAGRTFIPNTNLHYATTKAAIIGMTRQLAGDFAPNNITVNCVSPGPVDTPLARQNNPEVAARLRAAVPAGRSGTADEIACAVAFLVSEDASFIVGACIDVNGGAFMG